MRDALLKQALAELGDLVRCRCHPAYKDRGLHDPDCQCDSAEALQTVSDCIKVLAAERDALQAQLDETRNCLDSALHSVDVLERRAGEFRRQGNVAEQALAIARAFIQHVADGDSKYYTDNYQQAEAILALLDPPTPAPSLDDVVKAALEFAADARGLWLQFNSEGEPIGFCTVQPHDPGGMSMYINRDTIRAAASDPATIAAIIRTAGGKKDE